MNRLLVLVLSCLAIIFAMAAGMSWFMHRTSAQTAEATEIPASARVKKHDSDGHIEIARDSSGQFHLTAQVNGEDTRFLVDTGADLVALTVDDAKRIGIDADPATFEPIMQTASGIGKGAMVTLDRVEIGGDEYNNVDAVVVEGLTVSLLGQSVLRRVGQVQLTGDRLVIQKQS